MGLVLLGKKIGMTRLFTAEERSVPVTAIAVGPCVVTQVKTRERDGYAAVQLGFGEAKPRSSTRPMIGHDARARTSPKRWHREFRIGDDEVGTYEVGQSLGVDLLGRFAFVDVAGTSKGKGFQGTMKRHNFKGQQASHGVERKHRSPGSIGGHASNDGASGKLKKGKRMPGRMGGGRSTVRSLDVVRVDAERGLLLVKGAVPGPNGGMVEVREPSRLYTPKARKQGERVAEAG